MEITVVINNCKDCRHLDHSGAFTPGGARSICGHDKAVSYFTREKGLKDDDRYHWRHRVVDNEIKAKEVPENCPLQNEERY